MVGRRVDYRPGDENKTPFPFLEPGDYGKDRDGMWHCCAPREISGHPSERLFGNLQKHDVVEHPDGTITVTPSILVSHHKGTWHGYLERGVWREC